MAVEKWIAGTVGLTWTTTFTTANLNSLANGNALQGNNLDNSSNLDMFFDIAIQFASIAVAAPNYVGFYLYPLNQDATTYGDNKFTTTATGVPSAQYWLGNIGVPTGTATVPGTLLRNIMPPGQFKLVVYNQLGIALASSGNNIYWRTYNRQVV